jgi:hypothetical protein
VLTLDGFQTSIRPISMSKAASAGSSSCLAASPQISVGHVPPLGSDVFSDPERLRRLDLAVLDD